MNEQFFSKVLTPPQLQALGMVVVESAWLERSTEYLIARLCRLTKIKLEILLESRMMSSKLEALRQLGRAALKTDAKKDEFSELIRQAKEANTDRSTMVHGLWDRPGIIANVAGWEATVTKATSPGNVKTKSANEILGVAETLNQTNWRLILFVEENWPKLSVWHLTLRVRPAVLARTPPSKPAKHPKPPPRRAKHRN